MSRKSRRPPAPKQPASEKAPAPRRIRWSLWLGLAALGAALGSGLLARNTDRAWRPLPPGLGRIRWVETRTDFAVEPPLAPEWVRKLRAAGVPWPTDLPLQPLGASFGAPSGGLEQSAAWFLVQSARPSQELWHLQKDSVRLLDRSGAEVPWPGGNGAVLVDSERRLQYLYLLVPRELSGTGARLRIRLSRFDGPTSDPVSLPF